MFGDIFGRISGIFAMIIGVAALTVFLTSNNTAGIIDSIGKTFSSSLKISMGK